MEISIIFDNEVVYSKEFKKISKVLKREKVPGELINEIEYKFRKLMINEKFVRTMNTIASGIIIANCNTSMALAGDLNNTSVTIRRSLNPVIDLIGSLGYPLTYFIFIIGMFMIITGKKSKGLDIMKWAAIGYVGLQVIPFFLGLLEQIGHDLKSSLN